MKQTDEIAVLRAEVRRLTDRQEIVEVFDRFAAAADSRDWDAFRQIFAGDIVIDHTAVIGERGQGMSTVWSGFDDVMAHVTPGTERHLVTHHIIANHRIRLDGDRAAAVADMLQVSADPASDGGQTVEIQQGWYLTELVRTAEGWRIQRLKPSIWKAAVLPIAGALAPNQLEARRREVREALLPDR